LGETQILGQVRDAFLIAQRHQITGTIFNELFKRAITFAKRAHRETAIGENAVSISYAAVQLLNDIFENLSEKKIAIYGAGEMGKLAIQNLIGSGVTDITIVNRSMERALELANKYNTKSVSTDQLNDVLTDVDILISSTAALTPVLDKADLEPIQTKRNKSLYLIDIYIPRYLKANIVELENIYLYDIDDLQHIVDENITQRTIAAEQIALGIEGEVLEFKEWVANLGVVPVLAAIRNKGLAIQAETLKSINRKIPNLTEREQKVISKHTKSIINQMIKDPIIQAKEMAGKDNSAELLALVIDIFGLEDALKNEVVNRIELTNKLASLEERNE